MPRPVPEIRSHRALAALALALVLPALPFIAVGELPGAAWLDASGDRAARFAATGFALLAADIALPVPSSVVMTVLGGRLGAAAAWLVATAGLVLGNLAGYAFGRLVLARLGRPLPVAPTLLALVVSRPVPLLAEAVCLAAGASGVAAAPFLVASTVANAAMAAVFVAIGAALLPAGAAPLALGLSVAMPALAWLAWRRSRAGARR